MWLFLHKIQIILLDVVANDFECFLNGCLETRCVELLLFLNSNYDYIRWRSSKKSSKLFSRYFLNQGEILAHVWLWYQIVVMRLIIRSSHWFLGRFKTFEAFIFFSMPSRIEFKPCYDTSLSVGNSSRDFYSVPVNLQNDHLVTYKLPRNCHRIVIKVIPCD